MSGSSSSVKNKPGPAPPPDNGRVQPYRNQYMMTYINPYVIMYATCYEN